MSGISVKNQGKKPQGFLKETETNLCEITQKSMKNIRPWQLEAEWVGSQDDKKNWEQLSNTA